MKVLFVCNLGMNRSRTAAEMFKERFETRYRGIYDNLVSENDLNWADLIVVMEDLQRQEIGKRFPKEYLKKKIVSMDIIDVYRFMQPELVEIINKKANVFLQNI